MLADRINAAVYTVEELELLKCVADQMTSVLMNHRLAAEVAQARELEAFRTMSLFFVHDLKNAATSLNLMLRNLPVHFNDPAFREDALRGIGNSARRIDDMIARLSALRDRPTLSPAKADLNEVVSDALDRVSTIPNVQLTKTSSNWSCYLYWFSYVLFTLFIVPLDDQQAWFRYHHLFADVLRARLLAERQGSGRARKSRGTRTTASRRKRSRTRWPRATSSNGCDGARCNTYCSGC